MMKKIFLVLAMFFSLTISAQDFLEVSGKVNVQGTQEPLAGCHVFIHENLGTVTDQNGNFTFKIPAALANDQLHVSYVGFKDFASPIADISENFLQVNMEFDAILLEELVVIADPWDDFRESIESLTGIYSDKKELYAAILAELHKIDSQLVNPKLGLSATSNDE